MDQNLQPSAPTPDSHVASTVSIPAIQPYKDRRGWLIAFGVVQLLIAAVMFLFAVLMAFIPAAALAKNQPSSAQPMSMAAIAVFYALFGVLFATLGIGSIMSKNWARVVTFVVNWMWLTFGASGVIFMALLMPIIMQQMPQQHADVPQNFNQPVMRITLIFMSAFFIVLPGIFLAFYLGKNVKATCLRGQPIDGLDERPVLLTVLGCWLALSAISPLFVFFTPYPVIIFGRPLFGVAGKLVILTFGVVSAFAAWGFFTRNVRGWWVAFISNVFWVASEIYTITRFDIFQLYKEMGMDSQALVMMQSGF